MTSTNHDAVCIDCIKDKYLREYVKERKKKYICLECDSKKIGINIGDLVDFIEPYIRDNFGHGAYVLRHSLENDSCWEEQRGDDLIYVINTILGQSFSFDENIVSLLIDNDPADARDGDEPFYNSDINYVEIGTHIQHLHLKWYQIEEELKTRHRFFSNNARKFFDWLFEDIENLNISPINYTKISDPLSKRVTNQSVVRDLPLGTEVFRARRAEIFENCNEFIKNPLQELSPPPAKYAQAGRMNAKGVTIFYGAIEHQTCLAEMRSSIGSYTVLCRFKITENLRILDFKYLENALWFNKPLSYFQEDFEEQVMRRKFLRQIHKLISKPIVSNNEDEYLMTQVLAEYIAYIRTPNFDGLLFTSTQYSNGSNIVFFPKKANKKTIKGDMIINSFPLQYVENSAEIHYTKGITYDIEKRNFSLIGDKIYQNYDEYD